VQAYEGAVYMDFSRDIMERQGYGEYERLDPALFPPVYVAYRTSLSEGTEVFHNDVRARWRAGDPAVTAAMSRWAEIAASGRQALVDCDYETLDLLVNENFDLRARIYPISPGNLELIRTARSTGVSANFAGSGGAVVGICQDPDRFQRLVEAMRPIGAAVIRPKLVP